VQAIRIIKDEHRALAAVLYGMLYLVREIRYRDANPNFDLFEAMVYYIQAFPERFHHPKEEAYLFRILRLRSPDTAPLLDRLQAEHRASADKIRTLEQALARYRREGAELFAPFGAAVADYAAFHWDHAHAEESELLPLTEAFFTAADWEEIDAAFAGHSDPLVSVEGGADYATLFRRIVELAPPPLGVGSDVSGIG
jgi:hemerythrin-like domain-containing protein